MQPDSNQSPQLVEPESVDPTDRTIEANSGVANRLAPTDDELYRWTIQDTETEKRPTIWYVLLGLVFAIAIIAAIFTKAWFFIPLGILIPFALTKYVSRGAGAHNYSLNSFTFTIDEKRYRYEDFKSYFIVDHKNFTTFELVPLQRFGALISLHATGEEVDEIDDILSSVLPESEPQGYVGESFFDRLKF